MPYASRLAYYLSLRRLGLSKALAFRLTQLRSNS
jgi:hypothetical protein